MFIRILAVLALTGLFWMPGAPSYAQGAGTSVNPVITVLDIGQIRREAASVKAIRDQIIEYQNSVQGEVQEEQKALRAAQQDLAKKQSLLAPEAFAEERRMFEKRVVGVQQMVQEKRRTIDEAQKNAMLQVEKNLNEIVANMAAKNGYAIVLRRSQVVIVDSSLDITDTVLAELNKQLPTVNVDLPAQ